MTVMNPTSRILTFEHFFIVVLDGFYLKFEIMKFLHHLVHVWFVISLLPLSVQCDSAAYDCPWVRFLIGHSDIFHHSFHFRQTVDHFNFILLVDWWFIISEFLCDSVQYLCPGNFHFQIDWFGSMQLPMWRLTGSLVISGSRMTSISAFLWIFSSSTSVFISCISWITSIT